ncbi:hypothetical protein ACHAXS_004449 [Conticribra weissflogii]
MRHDTNNYNEYHSDQHRHQHHQTQSISLKCIVLGSSAAGKTSLLRRYIHGTFEDQGGGHYSLKPVSSRCGAVTPHASTLGADYYVKKVNNPLFERRSPSSRQRDSQKLKLSLESHVILQLWDTVGKERPSPLQFLNPRIRKRHHHQSSSNNSQHCYQFFLSHSSKKCLNEDSFSEHYAHSDSTDHSHNHTPLKKHYSNHLHIKEKTCVYTNNHVPNSKYQHHHRKQNTSHRTNNIIKSTFTQSLNQPMKNALFEHIDACMLVYDATSSMSFLQLMDWHEEMIRRLTTQHHDARGKHDNESRKRIIPFIVVANKIDLLDNRSHSSAGANRSGDSSYKQNASKRRSVMGFGKCGYVGEEWKYEYSTENRKFSKSCHDCDERNELDPSDFTGQSTPFHRKSRPQSDSNLMPKASDWKTKPSKDRSIDRCNKMTYSLKNTTWTTDTFYLEALQLAEDQLPANRPLILLWCQRNGIPHFEASALDGRGVDEAMQHLIQVGINQMKERETVELLNERKVQENSNDNDSQFDGGGVEKQYMPHGTSSMNYDLARNEVSNAAIAQKEFNVKEADETDIDPTTTAATQLSQRYFLYQPRYEKKLDLFARYSAKNETKCFPFKNCWLTLFSKCRR